MSQGLAIDERLRDMVAMKLKQDWLPQQISGWLKRHYPDDEAMCISHETIYRTLLVQARGRLCFDQGTAAGTDQGGCLHPGASARGRRRAVPGHWEGDLLAGSRNTHIATLLVERSSRFVMLVRVGGKDTESVVAALSSQIQKLPEAMVETLTWDRGMEMAAHKKVAVAADAAVYFCDPKSP